VNTVDAVSGRAQAHLCAANAPRPAANLLDKIREALLPERLWPDGGFEFRGQFRERSHKLGIVQHVLPPRSPKPNGHVESFGAAIAREILIFWILSGAPEELEEALKQLKHEYGNIRSRKSLDHETPVGWRNARAARIRSEIRQDTVNTSEKEAPATESCAHARQQAVNKSARTA